MHKIIKISAEIPVVIMYLKSLAEAMILQSIEDLCGSRYKEDGMKFFKGDGFIICSEIAGLNTVQRRRILRLLKRVLR